MIVVVLLGIVAGLLANELCDFSPWCARKIVRWSAFRRYADPGRAEMRADELAAVINDRPGNLFKLITAVSFAADAVVVSACRAVARESDADAGSSAALPADGVTYAVQWCRATCHSRSPFTLEMDRHCPELAGWARGGYQGMTWPKGRTVPTKEMIADFLERKLTGEDY